MSAHVGQAFRINPGLWLQSSERLSAAIAAQAGPLAAHRRMPLSGIDFDG